MQRLRLAEHGVRLAPGVQYRWFVALIPDADNRSQDVIASGSIQRIEPPAALQAQLAQTGKADAPFIYAAGRDLVRCAGRTSQSKSRRPRPTRCVRQQRAELLAQVELAEVAAV